ncbi:MAG TPA: tetratricopeptide repeat protein [Gemmatimonadaceae bacterium]|nr:tetratricopeptide repeat protein [Gemmatimonadaceae bacterium]
MRCGARLLALVPAIVLAAGACFATRGDVRLLQADIVQARAEAARADSLHRAQLLGLSRQVGVVADSLRSTNVFLARFAQDVSRFQGDLATSMHTFGQQLIAVQEQTGQSQKRLQEFRTDLEARSSELAASATSGRTGAGAPAGTPTVQRTGPLQLLDAATSQLQGGRNAAARAAFEDFLAQFPAHERASYALYSIAQTYESEGKLAAADSSYQLVVEKYPGSDQAPRALYKRAMLFVRAPGQASRARAIFQQIVDKYPGSPEAELARDKLKSPD